MAFLVAIDGPAGSGKSSVSQEVAKRLDFTYIDTGAIYRAVAYAASLRGISFDDEAGLAQLAGDLKVKFEVTENGQRVMLDGQDISREIRTEAMSQGSSKVSRHQKVRDALLLLQQQLAHKAPRGAIMEGRDIGTVVFPDADLKIFVSASDEVRAKRRFDELICRGVSADQVQILGDLRERDHRDKNRAVAPLKVADNAVVVDTSTMDQASVVDYICALIRQKYIV